MDGKLKFGKGPVNSLKVKALQSGVNNIFQTIVTTTNKKDNAGKSKSGIVPFKLFTCRFLNLKLIIFFRVNKMALTLMQVQENC